MSRPTRTGAPEAAVSQALVGPTVEVDNGVESGTPERSRKRKLVDRSPPEREHLVYQWMIFEEVDQLLTEDQAKLGVGEGGAQRGEGGSHQDGVAHGT